MSDQAESKFVNWPCYAAFFAGDAILLGCAYFIYSRHTGTSLAGWEITSLLLCAVLGAIFAVAPFVMEYQAAVKMVETGAIITAVSQIQNLEQIASDISGATSQWQGVQEHCARAVGSAQEIAQRITAEAAAFTEFLQKSNDGDRANLRLEVEKLRRVEGDWLQVVVRLLDHTYALHQAAVRSGQPGLIEQLGQFQNSCRDVARRVGLTPFIPAVNEPFNPQVHQSPDSQAMTVSEARIRETIACGYNFQGQLIRPALVSLQNPEPASTLVEETEIKAVKPARAAIEVSEQTLL